MPRQSVPDAKAVLRELVLAQRTALTRPEWDEIDAALARGSRALQPFAEQVTVAAYVSGPSEPGGLELLERLARWSERLLLPISHADRTLGWVPYDGASRLRAGRFGILEPDGPELPASAIVDAALVLVPALAVDRRGVRLGRGAGYYDRALESVSAAARVVAVVRDEELLDAVPGEEHDVPVDFALTPREGLVRLAPE